jgi:hypothetical protein
LCRKHKAMLTIRCKRILNEAAGIGTFLLKGLVANGV